MIVTDTELKAYDVSNEMGSSRPKLTYPTNFEYSSNSSRMFQSGNMIFIVFTIQQCEEHDSYIHYELFQINSNNIKGYNLNNDFVKNLFEYKRLIWKSCAIHINPKSKSVECIFDHSQGKPRYHGVGWHQSEVNWKDISKIKKYFYEKEEEKDIREDIRLERNNPLVYCRKKLYMNKYCSGEKQEGELEGEEYENEYGEEAFSEESER